MKEKNKKRVLLESIINLEERQKSTLAIPVVTYSFIIINWTIPEIRRLHMKICKLLTCNRMHYLKADVDRLYIPRNEGGSGMIQLELSYKT